MFLSICVFMRLYYFTRSTDFLKIYYYKANSFDMLNIFNNITTIRTLQHYTKTLIIIIITTITSRRISNRWWKYNYRLIRFNFALYIKTLYSIYIIVACGYIKYRWITLKVVQCKVNNFVLAVTVTSIILRIII